MDSSIPRKEENEKNTADSIAGDTHRPEYYLAQIPLTEEAMQASNTLLSEALYGAGMIFKDRMQDFKRQKLRLNDWYASSLTLHKRMKHIISYS